MENLAELNEKIKVLKQAHNTLNEEYKNTDYHKKKEAHPHSTASSSPEDEEVYKLLIAIQQLDHFIKKYQEKQFELLKKEE